MDDDEIALVTSENLNENSCQISNRDTLATDLRLGLSHRGQRNLVAIKHD